MGEKFLLRIDNPCHENWDEMTPNERGRFCSSCQKTVVDFTAMSDAEVVHYLARAGQHVCGQVSEQQLQQPLSVKREGLVTRGRRVWYWMVAGLLIAARVQGQTKGKIRVIPDAHVTARPVGIAGKPAMIEATKPVVDSFKVLPECTVKGYYADGVRGLMTGAVVEIRDTKVIKKIKDTLVAVGLVRRQPVSVYPSPVQRGAAVQLSWDTAAGSYRVGLYSLSGALIFERPMQVGERKQVDLIEIPAGIAAGLYVIRVSGAGRPFSQKIVVM